MAKTNTKFLSFQALRLRGKEATTVIKLMMACNDLTVTNQALADWKIEERLNRRYRRDGACSYFLRAQIGHLHEGLKVIEEIRDNPKLSEVVKRCDPQPLECFQELQRYLPKGDKYSSFDGIAGRIRHNLTFHYDESGKLTTRAIQDRASRWQQSSITRGDTAHLWHFKIADDVVDSIVVRQIFKIPRGEDLRSESDRIAGEMHEVFKSYLIFSGDFIWKYCEW